MDTLQDKIAKINEDYDKKQAAAIEKLAEERAMAIARETVNNTITNLKAMSVGNIITIFENVSPYVLKTRGGKNTINDFMNLMKEDKNLRNSYALKENIVPGETVADPREFISEAIAVAKENTDRKSFNKSKMRLVNLVSEALKNVSPIKIYEKIDIDEETRRINDNIETLLWGDRSIKNAANRTNSINEAIDFITRKQTVTESREDVFEEYKEKCITSINEAWETADAAVRIKLTEIRERISKKEYSELTADNDIKYMKELIETVK